MLTLHTLEHDFIELNDPVISTFLGAKKGHKTLFT